MPEIHKILKDTRYRLSAVLLLVWIAAIYNFGLEFAFPTVAASIILAGTVDFAINKIFRDLAYFPISGVITGLIVGLIVSPVAGIHLVTASAILAVLSKHILTYQKGALRAHIFNPAGFGVLVSSLLFATPVAWWGVSWWPEFFWVLIPTAGYIIYKIGRLPIVSTFIAIYGLNRLILTSDLPGSILATLDSTAIFFALIMLPEPQSTPNTGIWKYGFGLMVGILAMSSRLWPWYQGDLLISALLLANLLSFGVNRFFPKVAKG